MLILLNGGAGGGGGGGPLGSLVGQHSVKGVAATPGWEVVGAIWLTAVPSSIALEAIMLVTQAALTGRVQLYDTVAVAAVAGSTLSTGSTTDVRLLSGTLAGALVTGRIYQLRIECTGGSLITDEAVLRSARLRVL